MGASKIADFCQKLFPEGFARTPRLLLTPLEASDAFQLVVLTNDPLVAAGVSLLRQPFTIADAQDLIALSRLQKGCFASVRFGDDGPFVGCVGALVRNETDIEIGFWVGVPYHGKRYGAEAARAMLGMLRDAFPERRVVAECPRENSASWRALLRLGFCPDTAKSAPRSPSRSAPRSARRGAELLTYKTQEAVN